MSWCSMILPGHVGHWRIKRFQEGFPGFHLISSRIFEVFWDPSVKVTEMEILNPDQLGLVGCLRAMGEPTQDRNKSIKRKPTEMYKPRNDIHPSALFLRRSVLIFTRHELRILHQVSTSQGEKLRVRPKNMVLVNWMLLKPPANLVIWCYLGFRCSSKN